MKFSKVNNTSTKHFYLSRHISKYRLTIWTVHDDTFVTSRSYDGAPPGKGVWSTGVFYYLAVTQTRAFVVEEVSEYGTVCVPADYRLVGRAEVGILFTGQN